MLPIIGTSVPDGFGGMIVTTCASGSPMTIIDFNAKGEPLWHHASIAACEGMWQPLGSSGPASLSYNRAGCPLEWRQVVGDSGNGRTGIHF